MSQQGLNLEQSSSTAGPVSNDSHNSSRVHSARLVLTKAQVEELIDVSLSRLASREIRVQQIIF